MIPYRVPLGAQCMVLRLTLAGHSSAGRDFDSLAGGLGAQCEGGRAVSPPSRSHPWGSRLIPMRHMGPEALGGAGWRGGAVIRMRE